VGKPIKIYQLEWTTLQREIAGKLLEGKTFEEVLAGGYAKSTLSKVYIAVKAGQRPSSNQEPVPANTQEPAVNQELGTENQVEV